MGLWESLSGTVQVEITSASPKHLLSAANDCGITLYEVVLTGELCIHAVLFRKDYQKLAQLVARRGEKISVLKRSGIYWSLAGLYKRPLLVTALIIYSILVFYLPTRIFFIRVEGNKSVTTWQILDTAQNYGLSFASPRREIRSEKIKNALLESLPQLQWAGVNTRGCVATITVLEKDEVPNENEPRGLGGIFASRDGVIRTMTVKKGNPVCNIGQAVQEGQLLVSGYTDCGLVVKAEVADAEIYAETSRNYETVAPTDYTYRDGDSEIKTRYSIIIGKKLINFFKSSRISDMTCVKMYKEYYLTLPGGFQLPAALIVETAISYPFSEKREAELEDFAWVEDDVNRYVRSQMLAGEITNAAVTQELRDNIYYQHGNYACYEMISQARIEEIKEDYGKTD